MTLRIALALSLSWICLAGPQDQAKKQPPPAAQEATPPEVDTAVAPTEYSFNPLQAEKDLRVGNFYWKQGKYRAAEARFREATKWNENLGAAWLRLGEANEKLKDTKAAREAYAKYLEVASDAKNVAEIRKRLEKLK